MAVLRTFILRDGTIAAGLVAFLKEHADPPGASRTAQRLVARAIEAAHGITAPGAPDAAPNVWANRTDPARKP